MDELHIRDHKHKKLANLKSLKGNVHFHIPDPGIKFFTIFKEPISRYYDKYIIKNDRRCNRH